MEEELLAPCLPAMLVFEAPSSRFLELSAGTKLMTESLQTVWFGSVCEPNSVLSLDPHLISIADRLFKSQPVRGCCFR